MICLCLFPSFVSANEINIEEFTEKAEKGDIQMQFTLGYYYDHGIGVKKDFKKSLMWYLKASEQGDARSMYYLAVKYKDGTGVAKDLTQAIKWYKLASELGHTHAEDAYNAIIDSQNPIQSPDGYYHVSKNGIFLINVTSEKIENNKYKVEFIVVKSSAQNNLLNGTLIRKGWWYPESKQFYTETKYHDMPGNSSSCSVWDEYQWSFRYLANSLKIKDREIIVYKAWNTDIPNNQKPRRYCYQVNIERATCDLYTCGEWKWPFANSLFVKSKQDAIDIFSEKFQKNR